MNGRLKFAYLSRSVVDVVIWVNQDLKNQKNNVLVFIDKNRSGCGDQVNARPTDEVPDK